MIAVFEGEKTLVFWVGLLVFGYSLSQFCAAIWQTIYFLVVFPSEYPHTSVNIVYQLVYPIIPSIISAIIFAIIGLYMMKKGVKQNQPSAQN